MSPTLYLPHFRLDLSDTNLPKVGLSSLLSLQLDQSTGTCLAWPDFLPPHPFTQKEMGILLRHPQRTATLCCWNISGGSSFYYLWDQVPEKIPGTLSPREDNTPKLHSIPLALWNQTDFPPVRSVDSHCPVTLTEDMTLLPKEESNRERSTSLSTMTFFFS